MRRVLLAMVVLACGACSMALDWDVNKLKCNADPNQAQCLPGHTCLNNVCVANGSLGQGATCTQQAQCSGAQICAQAYVDRPCTNDPTCNTCLTACSVTNAYSSAGCGTVSYCMPYCMVPSGAKLPDGTFPACDPNNEAAACVATDGCTANSTCTLQDSSALGVCTAMGNGVTACLQACSFNWTASGYNDGCGGTTATPRYCTPVGETNSQQLVCVNVRAGPLGVGSTGCDALSMPCGPGNACIHGTCSQLCHLGAASACNTSGQTCTAIPGLGGSPAGITTSNTGYCK